MVLIFDESVQAGTGNIVLTPDAGSTITIPITDSQVRARVRVRTRARVRVRAEVTIRDRGGVSGRAGLGLLCRISALIRKKASLTLRPTS